MPTTNNVQLTKFDLQCVRDAISYVDRNYRNRISAEHLAIEVNLSPRKLQAGLLHLTGLKLHKYHLKVRVEKAKLLLEDSDKPVKFIASDIGFKRPSYFINTFKVFTSLTPHAYRLLAAG